MSAAETKSARTYDEKTSTARHPYHYTGTGLSNVYLVGVTFRIDRTTGEESVGIPCLPTLLEALAKALVEKRSPMTAAEVRFLRKRMRTPPKRLRFLCRLERGAILAR